MSQFQYHVLKIINGHLRRNTRAYFRIHRKCQTCSKRASYHDNTSWPDSPKQIKVLVTIGLNRLSSLHIASWHITLFSFLFPLEDFENDDDSRNRNTEIFFFFFFSRSSQKYHYWIVESTNKTFIKNSVKVSPTCLGS